MPVPNRKTADTVRVCTYVCVAAVSCRPSVQYGGIAPEPWARGALPRARCAACVNVNVNSLHRGPNRGISTEEMFAK